MMTKIKKFKNWIIALILGATVLAVGTQPITPEEIKWKKFTDNLVNIEYKHCGKDIKKLKNIKGIWRPTEQEFEEIYQYAYGFDMVNWQLPDGTPMCGIGKEAINCVPHWKQEFENNKFRGNKQGNILSGLRNVRKNEVNADIYDIRLISKKQNNFVLMDWLIQKVFAGVEFEDHFNVGADTKLADWTPDTTGTGYTLLERKGAVCDLYIDSATDDLDAGESSTTGGCFSSEGGVIEGDDTMSGANYTVEVTQTNGDTSDDYNWLLCRIADSGNYYIARFNETDTAIYREEGSSCWGSGAGAGAGIADGSIVTLDCNGTSIRLLDDDVENLAFTNSAHAGPGKAGLGMGATDCATLGDVSAQQLDNFIVTVSGAPPAERRIVNIQ